MTCAMHEFRQTDVFLPGKREDYHACTHKCQRSCSFGFCGLERGGNLHDELDADNCI